MERYTRETVTNPEGEGDQERVLRKRFNEQFEKIEKIDFRGTSFEALDLRPDISLSETPVLFVPGYGKSPRSYKEALFETYKTGRRIIAVEAPLEDVQLSETEKGDFPDIQAMRALALLQVLKEKSIQKVDVIGHSEGGMNATVAASMDPEQFRHFVFVALPGVTDEQSWPAIAKRFVENQIFIANERKTRGSDVSDRYKFGEDESKAFAKERGSIKAIYESGYVGKVGIVDFIKNIRKTGHGVSIIAGVDDKMLPMKEYQRKTDGSKRSVEDMGGVDGFYSVIKGHGEMVVNDRVGALAAHALEALGAKYEKHEVGEDVVDMSYVDMASGKQ